MTNNNPYITTSTFKCMYINCLRNAAYFNVREYVDRDRRMVN